jgi:hypothetical protein
MIYPPEVSTLKVGDEYPVWWETFDGRPAGHHQARVLEIKSIKPYLGLTVILKLECPGTKKGWLWMSA